MFIFDFLNFRCSYCFHFFFLSYLLFVFVIRAFAIGHERMLSKLIRFSGSR